MRLRNQSLNQDLGWAQGLHWRGDNRRLQADGAVAVAIPAPMFACCVVQGSVRVCASGNVHTGGKHPEPTSLNATPLPASSSGVTQPRAPSMAQRAWISSSSR